MRKEKIRKMKENKGITLLALVITIVILIILALVAINYAFGENGLVNYSDKAKLETEIASAQERLEIVLGSAYTEKKTSNKYESEEDFLNNHLEEYVYEREPDANIERDGEDGDTISLNGYVFALDRSIPQLGGYIGPSGNLPPKIRSIKRVETSNPYSELGIEVTSARADGGTYKYSIKKEGEEYSSPVEGGNTYTFTNLESQVKYWIKVELVMNGELVDTKEEPMILGLLEEGNLNFGDITWGAGKASITVSTITSMQIQYRIIPDEGETTGWTNISNNGTIPNISNKSTVSARLWDGKNGSEEISRTIKDIISPVITKFEATEVTWNSITVEVNAVDNESGLASTNTYKFYLNDEKEVKGTSTDGTYQYTSLTISDKEVNYKIRVEVYDNAGNKSEKIIENVNTKAVIMKIYTKEDMEKFRDTVNRGFTYEGYTVELMNDIDLQGIETNQWVPIGDKSLDDENLFNGNFNGNFNTISNIYINKPEKSNVGLFGATGNHAEIKNLSVDGRIIGDTNVGGIVAIASDGIIKNCINKASVSGKNNVGGVVAYVSSLSTQNLIDGCANLGKIECPSDIGNVGGICGLLRGTVMNSYNVGSVSSNLHNIGGIGGIGLTQSVTISHCYNIGEIKGSSSSFNVGGILGVIKYSATPSAVAKLEYCINAGSVYLGPKLPSSNIGGTSGIYPGYIIGALIDDDSSCSNSMSIKKETLKNYSNEELSDILGSEFVKDENNINNGFPILKWQLEQQN